MDEFIERKKLEEAFDNADPDVCESDLDGHSDWGFGRENVRDVIRGVPAADVAPVVRCKDCRYAGVHVVDDTHEIVGHWCGLLDIDDVSDDDFCSFGKRKENEKDD